MSTVTFTTTDEPIEIVDPYAKDRREALEIMQETKEASEDSENAKNASINAQIASETAKNEAIEAKNTAVEKANEINGYVIPTEATYPSDTIDSKDNIVAGVGLSAYGYTKNVSKSDRWLETDTPNIIVDKISEPIRFSDGIYDRTTDQQVILPNAPFSPSSTDELLDYSQHGVTTQSNHTKGDIVVCGNGQELVDDGVFTDISKWDNTINCTSSVSDNILTVSDSDDTGTYSSVRNQINLIYGVKYKVVFEITETTSKGWFTVWNSDNYTGEATGDIYQHTPLDVGNHIIIFTSSSTGIKTYGLGVDGAGTTKYKNFSITPIERSYIAIENTTAGTLLTDTTKFTPIDYVTRQDPILLTKTGYKTFKGYKFFAKDEMYADKIAEEYGFSKLGNGLYHDGTEEVIIAGLVPRLNAGAYCPIYNVFGSASWKNIDFLDGDGGAVTWYSEKAYNPNSLFLSLVNKTVGQAAGNGSLIGTEVYFGRPDEKLYDKIYFEANGGLIFLPTYAKEANLTDLLTDEFNKMVSGDVDLAIDSGVECIDAADIIISSTSFFGSGVYIVSGVDDYIVFKNNKPVSPLKNPFIEIHSINGKATLIAKNSTRYKRLYVSNDVYYGLPFSGNQGKSSKIITCSKYLTTQGRNLTVDVVGNPSNYPNDWKDYLNSQKALPFNPLLVGENGEDLVPDGTSKTFKMSNKVIDMLLQIFTQDSGDTYTTSTLNESTLEGVTNASIASTDASEVRILPYIKQNLPLIKSDPMPIIQVLPKVLASNSHSIYKGAMLTNSVTDKVAVGNGSNGLESKYLENGEIDENNAITTTPQHNQIELDNEASPTSKSFATLAIAENNEYCLQVIGKEIIYDDTDGFGDNGKFDVVSNSVQADLNGNNIINFVGIKRLGVFKK